MDVEEILLLTGEVEGPYLADALRSRCERLIVAVVHDNPSLMDAVNVAAKTGRPFRLVSFSTDVIVPASIIEAMSTTGYNFHAGPPEYPGSCPASFAVYEGARRFGITVHEISTEIDSGTIVAVRRFDIPPDITATDLMGQTYQALVALFSELAPAMIDATVDLTPIDEQWRPPARKRSEAVQLASPQPDLPADEADRRRRAFGHLCR